MADSTIDDASIRNLVFDLGGVLYAIDPSRTTAALKRIAGPCALPMQMDDPLFIDFELGKLDSPAFLARLREAIDSQADDALLEASWNALLLGLMPQRAAWITRLAEHYRVILLSNTNVMHQQIWGPQCQAMFDQMEHTWFSFDLGLRKPDPAVFQHVLHEMGMKPEETLFFDDSPLNLAGAHTIGIHTRLVTQENDEDFDTFCLKVLLKV